MSVDARRFRNLAVQKEAEIAAQQAADEAEIIGDWPIWAQKFWKKAGENAGNFSQKFPDNLHQQIGVIA